MPAARTVIRTSPGPTGGSDRSWTRRTSYPPCPVRTTAFIAGGTLYPRLQVDRAPDEEAVHLEDALDRLRRHRRVGRQRHHRPVLGRLGANGRGDDVHALLAEHRA